MGISVAKLTNYSRNELKSPHKIIPGPNNYFSITILVPSYRKTSAGYGC